MKKKSPIYPEGQRLGQSRIPADQLNQQNSANQAVSLVNVAPPTDRSVVSVFDTLPINATTFDATNRVVFNSLSVLGAVDAEVRFVVPPNRVAILRFISFHIAGSETQFTSIDRFGIRMPYDGGSPRCVITLDNVVQISVGSPANDRPNLLEVKRLPVYLVASEGQTIAAAFLSPVVTEAIADVTISGVLLLATGAAINYEPGTLYPLPVKQIV